MNRDDALLDLYRFSYTGEYSADTEKAEEAYKIIKKEFEKSDYLKMLAVEMIPSITEVLNPNYRKGNNIIGDILLNDLGRFVLEKILNILKSDNEVEENEEI